MNKRNEREGEALPSLGVEGEVRQDPHSYNHVLFTAVLKGYRRELRIRVRMSVVDVDKLAAVVGLEVGDER